MSTGMLVAIALVGGLALGFVLAGKATDDAYRAELAKGVRAQAVSSLGTWAGTVGDTLGLWGPGADVAAAFGL